MQGQESGDEGGNDEHREEDYEDAGFGVVEAKDGGPPEHFCQEGQLFVDGTSSGDVIQGALGDCWFLGALSVVATRQDLIEEVFWKLGKYQDYGLFVCRFYKDFKWKYVKMEGWKGGRKDVSSISNLGVASETSRY